VCQTESWKLGPALDANCSAKTRVEWQYKPIDWKDYKVAFTDSEKARMQKIFSTGVCDWSKPGVGTVPLKGSV